MKLSTKMVLIFSIAVYTALGISLAVMYDKSYNFIILEAENRGVSAAKFFESQMPLGFNDELPDGTNPTYQEDLDAALHDETIVLLEHDPSLVVDVTAPLHYGDNIDYVIGTMVDLGMEQSFLTRLVLLTLAIGAFAFGVTVYFIFLFCQADEPPHPSECGSL